MLQISSRSRRCSSGWVASSKRIQPKEVTVVSYPAPKSVLVIVSPRDGDCRRSGKVFTRAEERARRQ